MQTVCKVMITHIVFIQNVCETIYTCICIIVGVCMLYAHIINQYAN